MAGNHPFSVSKNFCYIGGDTVEELAQNIAEFTDNPHLPTLIQAFDAITSGRTQGVVREVFPSEPGVEQAVATLAAAGVTGTEIEERTDRFGGRYVKGEPNGGATCEHGPRIVAYKTSKAGKKYKALVCVNDSPFGDYRNGKCPQEYPN